VPQWAKLRNGENISLERALGAFDLFIPESGFGDLDDVCHMSIWAGLHIISDDLT